MISLNIIKKQNLPSYENNIGDIIKINDNLYAVSAGSSICLFDVDLNIVTNL